MGGFKKGNKNLAEGKKRRGSIAHETSREGQVGEESHLFGSEEKGGAGQAVRG